MAAQLVTFPNVNQPLIDPRTLCGTRPWLAYLADIQRALGTIQATCDSISSALTALQTTVAGLSGGASAAPGKGVTAYPLGGGEDALVSNASLVWMTVKSPVRVRVNWTVLGASTAAVVYAQVHSDASMVNVTPRLVAVDTNGDVARVVWTGTATPSKGQYASEWSPLERAVLAHGTGTEDLVLQVYSAVAGLAGTATGYLELGGTA